MRLRLLAGFQVVGSLDIQIASRLGLFRHGAEHGLRQVDLFHFHIGDLYAPRRGMRIQNALQPEIDFVAVREQFVEFLFTQDRAERGLSKL